MRYKFIHHSLENYVLTVHMDYTRQIVSLLDWKVVG